MSKVSAISPVAASIALTTIGSAGAGGEPAEQRTGFRRGRRARDPPACPGARRDPEVAEAPAPWLDRSMSTVVGEATVHGCASRKHAVRAEPVQLPGARRELDGPGRARRSWCRRARRRGRPRSRGPSLPLGRRRCPQPRPTRGLGAAGRRGDVGRLGERDGRRARSPASRLSKVTPVWGPASRRTGHRRGARAGGAAASPATAITARGTGGADGGGALEWRRHGLAIRRSGSDAGSLRRARHGDKSRRSRSGNADPRSGGGRPPSRVPSRIRPSTMWTVRRVRAARSGSWVTITIVRPPLHQRLEQPEHLLGGLRVEVAGGLVGDEDRRVVGERAGDRHALLLAAGRARRAACGLVGHPDLLQQVHRPLARARRRARPQKSIGSITFSTTVSVGSSWKNWKTTPTVRPRHCAIRLSPRACDGPCRRRRTSPDVGRSMPVIMFMSVDLPLPDLPTTADELAGVDLEVERP